MICKKCDKRLKLIGHTVEGKKLFYCPKCRGAYYPRERLRYEKLKNR